MKYLKYLIQSVMLFILLLTFNGCNDKLDELAENRSFNQGIDYSISGNMKLPLVGAYAAFYNRGWEEFPFVSVRGDDVNKGGLGDAIPFENVDDYTYSDITTYWMNNSAWIDMYGSIFKMESAKAEIEKYVAGGANTSLASQYKAEINVMEAFILMNISRTWGKCFIPKSSNPADLYVQSVSTNEEVLKYIADQMTQAATVLPDMAPKYRTDFSGGVTKYAALAIEAKAKLELKDYAGVAAITSQIISSGKFSLEPDFFKLWDINGKLNKENILELQYSDLGSGSGNNYSYLFGFFGPQNWTPAVSGSGGGWGFWEPSMKYVKFMLDRGEKTRLQCSVLFTNRGITEIKKDSKYATLPSWISNKTVYGDQMDDMPREIFLSGKQYFPSNQLTAGRTDYGTNKNFTCIRYAEILLMHAEALTNGATSTTMTAQAAVNAVRARAGLTNLSSVTLAEVLDEKYAELAMEWGIRFYDMVRYSKYTELNYDGRTAFIASKVYLPLPQAQIDMLPALGN